MSEKKAKAKGRGQSIILIYKGFRQDLKGWVDVKFVDFRDTIFPLRRKPEWAKEERSLVSTLILAGGGYAVKRLLSGSQGSREAQELFKFLKMGNGPDYPEEMTKSELESHMAALIKSCTTAGWSADNYLSFMAYLDSTMTMKDLAETKAPAGAASMFHDARATASPPSEEDLFAKKFRTGTDAYKAVVRDSLKKAAECVPSSSD